MDLNQSTPQHTTFPPCVLLPPHERNSLCASVTRSLRLTPRQLIPASSRIAPCGQEFAMSASLHSIMPCRNTCAHHITPTHHDNCEPDRITFPMRCELLHGKTQTQRKEMCTATTEQRAQDVWKTWKTCRTGLHLPPPPGPADAP